jgi:hypothetical protein
MVIEIDNMGRINLSHRAILEGDSPEDYTGDQEIPSPMTRRSSTLAPARPPMPRQPRPDGGGGNFRGGGGGGGGRRRGGGGGNRGNGGRPRPPASR